MYQDVDLTSQASAARSIEHLDKALIEVSASQSRLGALQNRMQYTINNLSQAAMNTEVAIGRIVDADFAVESMALAKISNPISGSISNVGASKSIEAKCVDTPAVNPNHGFLVSGQANNQNMKKKDFWPCG